MTKLKILLLLSVFSVLKTVSADDCSFSTDYNIKILPDSILFSKNKLSQLQFRGDNLLINREKVELSDKQREASRLFQKQTRLILPKVADVAVEGAELGINASVVTLKALFCENNEMAGELTQSVEKLGRKIRSSITDTRYDAETLGDSLDNIFDDEFEKLIEQATVKYSGKMMSNILASVFSGDKEELKDLEFRMENLGHDIETYVEANVKTLETKAKALCQDAEILEKFDSVLETVAGYPENGLIN